ncbi:MAG TPA: ABC transporter substrate-binding protein [Stellaceae bacterium]|jgi:NitT/TauT family transport system substrate-binding protein|nr:ABC transporter substrate-binding protein [Stellaceae bacterium]
MKTLRLVRATLLALVLLTPLSVAAPTVEAGTEGDGGTVRLLYNEPGTNSFIPFTIKKFALDKKHGFALAPMPTATTQTAITALQTGAADAGTFGWNDMGRMINGGISVIGVAPFLRWGADFIVVPTDSPIKTLADLKGKKVGAGTKSALNWIVMRAVGEKVYGLDIEKEATSYEGSPVLLRGLIENGQLDATHIFNSIEPSMVATGKFRPLTKISDLVHMFGLPDTPFLLYAFDTKYVAAKPGNVRAFVAAYEEAVNILRTNDEVWLERGRQLGFTDEVSALFRKEARTDIWLRFEPDTEANIRHVFDVMLPIAGVEALGTATMPTPFMTVEFQQALIQ